MLRLTFGIRSRELYVREEELFFTMNELELAKEMRAGLVAKGWQVSLTEISYKAQRRIGSKVRVSAVA
jgi:hypothetical protein